MDATDQYSTGVIEWQVFDSGKSPPFPPTANAGHDRVVVLPAVTYLHGSGHGIGTHPTQTWNKSSGPGDVTFADAGAPNTTASFTMPGDYDLKFTYQLRGLATSAIVHVQAVESLLKKILMRCMSLTIRSAARSGNRG